ncbi:Tetraspanin-19 [Heracleum sosnowskyi]|uniref:Tetraspanin-19 n=1 Tax=Heracleum sosnowskyi TaxID=360622 RepID=A0AAD8IPL9_9APIA|nr:Tetraspanin-19 [Heracleum sosnowskyi]
MGRRSCVKSLLKHANSLIGMFAIATILYALWMLTSWHRDVHADNHPLPWFIYTFFALGASLCLITCFGHIAAETVNGCCLYSYALFVFLFFMLEVAVIVEILLDRDWEEDFPEDPTGNFGDLKDFIMENFQMCKWIGFSIMTIQGLCMLLAMILKALGPDNEANYESDDNYIPEGVPLLTNYPPQLPIVVGDPIHGYRNGSSSVKFNK